MVGIFGNLLTIVALLKCPKVRNVAAAFIIRWVFFFFFFFSIWVGWVWKKLGSCSAVAIIKNLVVFGSSSKTSAVWFQVHTYISQIRHLIQFPKCVLKHHDEFVHHILANKSGWRLRNHVILMIWQSYQQTDDWILYMPHYDLVLLERRLD